MRSSLAQAPTKHRGRVGSYIARHQPLVVILSIIVALLISSAWLAFPYLMEGQKVLSDVGGSVKQEKLNRAISIGKFLTRSSFGPGEAQVDVLFATPRYFEITDRADKVAQYRPDKYLVFFVTETTHTEELPRQLPSATLTVNGESYSPVDTEGPLEIYHHRTVTLRFPAFDSQGRPLALAEPDSLTLALRNNWDAMDTAREFSWQVPLTYPEGVDTQSAWTPISVLGLSAGLLSFVLTPCLIQLLVVYVMTLTGFTADQAFSVPRDMDQTLRKRLFNVALWFVAGFSGLFTLTGALVGRAGKEMQMFFATWSETVSIAAGIVIILMGIYIGVRSRAPLVCNIVPLKQKLESLPSGSYVGSALIAVGFSLGCITCFGGAIIATLLIYVGSIGSSLVGALVMFAFSLGVVIPFLLAAMFLSRVFPLITGIQRYAPYIGLASMLALIAFGLVLLTNNFHVLSDLIYPYLGLN